jgi:hypothetical protein
MNQANNEHDPNEKTRVDFDALKNQLKNQATQQKEKEGEDEMAPDGNNSAKKSKLKEAGAGVGGAAVGAGAAMLFMGLTPAPDPAPDPDPVPIPIPEPAHFDGSKVPIATGVNDDMSFSEAFAAARTEVGPGGVFEWRGGVYGTYYANEWAGFSDDYKQHFSNYQYDVVRHDDLQQTTDDTGQNIPHESEANGANTAIHLGQPEQLEIEGLTVTAVPVYTGNNHEPTAMFVDIDNDGVYDIKVDSEGNIAQLPQQDEFTYQVLINEYDGKPVETLIAGETEIAGMVANEVGLADNEVVVLHDTIDGHDVAYVQTVIDGEEVVFIDGVTIGADGNPVPENADGTFDVAIVGEDIYDIHNEDIKIDDIQAHSDPTPNGEQYVDYTPDFENNANVNDFIDA